DGNQGKHRVTKRGPALSYPMFTLVTGIVGRWGAVCVTALQRPNSDAAAIRIVVGIAAVSLSVTVRKLVDVTPVKELLSQKWNSFGYKTFLVWMLSYLAYMVIFTTASLYRPLTPLAPGEGDNITVMKQRNICEAYESTEDLVRLAGEIITLFGAIFILVSEIPLLIKLGPKKYIGNASTGGPFSLLMYGLHGTVNLMEHCCESAAANPLRIRSQIRTVCTSPNSKGREGVKGKCYKTISKQLDFPVTTVAQIIQKFKIHGIVASLPGGGRRRKIDDKSKRRIMRMVTKEPRKLLNRLKVNLKFKEHQCQITTSVIV
ncbi:unnamed protein product, partial [Ranitomeya imitator]